MSKLWKETERRIASLLGGQRVPITGRQRGDVPDIAHDFLAIEVKERRHLPGWLLDGMAQAVAAARGGQMPIVVLHQAGDRYEDALVVVRLKDWREWYGAVQTTRE